MTRRNRPRRVRAALLTGLEELRDRLVPDEIPLDYPRADQYNCRYPEFKRRVREVTATEFVLVCCSMCTTSAWAQAVIR